MIHFLFVPTEKDKLCDLLEGLHRKFDDMNKTKSKGPFLLEPISSLSEFIDFDTKLKNSPSLYNRVVSTFLIN